MRRVLICLCAVIALLSCAAPVFAQGGGASSTGTIQGRVVDAQGEVPGVTVTVTGAALIQPLTTVTSESVEITLGFTAHVNVELGLANLQETVTVSGQSPVIDTTTTRVQQNFTMDQLQSGSGSRSDINPDERLRFANTREFADVPGYSQRLTRVSSAPAPA